MLNRKLRFSIDLLKQSIKDSVFENHVYIVGGCLRDSFSNLNNFNDIDVVIDNNESGYMDFCKFICNKFNCRSLYNPFIEKSNKTSVFTLYNINYINDVMFDVKMTQNKEKKSFGTLEEDYNTVRDFTMNALYYNISTNELIEMNEMSISDIENKIIRQCNENVFKNHPLNILRAMRFLSYGYVIEENTFENLKNNISLTNEIPSSHLDYERKKINGLANNSKTIDMLKYFNIDYKSLGIIEKNE